MVTKVAVLAYYKLDINAIIKTDSLDYVNSKIFSWLNNNRLLHNITFFSKNLNFTEYNYKIYNNKFLAIIQYLKQ